MLGLGHEKEQQPRRPTRVRGLADVQQISAGWKHNAAVTDSGLLYTWGWGGSQGGWVVVWPDDWLGAAGQADAFCCCCSIDLLVLIRVGQHLLERRHGIFVRGQDRHGRPAGPRQRLRLLVGGTLCFVLCVAPLANLWLQGAAECCAEQESN